VCAMIMEFPGIEIDKDGDFIRLTVQPVIVRRLLEAVRSPPFYCIYGSVYMSTGITNKRVVHE